MSALECSSKPNICLSPTSAFTLHNVHVQVVLKCVRSACEMHVRYTLRLMGTVCWFMHVHVHVHAVLHVCVGCQGSGSICGHPSE